ncbi:MAG: secretin N-terminal domain-containing protein, partial [Pirellulaceae bacterium]
MLSLSTFIVRLACAAGVIVLLLSPPCAGAREAKSSTGEEKPAEEAKSDDEDAQPEDAEDAEAEPKAESSPSDAQPKPKPPAEKKEAEPDLPDFNYASLAHPSIADQLELTDEQRAAVAKVVNQRATKLASAAPEERQEVLETADRQLAAILTPEQLEQLSALTVEHKLRFNFREQEWADVLDWFARQAGLALVMDKSPPGFFTYTSNKAYAPTEALDLLNSVLLTKGFTLIRRDRMLILVDLSAGLPTNLIPRVPEDEIGEHGDFQFITVLFPLAGRPVDTVVEEVQPLIGNYGTCVGLPRTGQLLVTETAAKMQAISILITSIPEPKKEKKPERKEPREKPPPPVLAVYPVKHIEPASAVDMLSILFSGAKFTVDEKGDQVMAYAKPSEQEAIKAAVEQMEANRPPDKQPRLEVYPVDLPNPAQLLEQLTAVMPEIQASVDTELDRLLVFGTPEDQEAVKEMLTELGGSVGAGGHQVAVYQLEYFDPAELATLIEEFAPRAEVATDAKLRRVVVSASSEQQAMIESLVEQLDKESALQDQPVLQVYPLEKALDEGWVESLESLVPDAELTLSEDGLQLSVMGRVVDQTVVKKMIEQWKEATAEREEPELKIHSLETKLSASDVTTIESLVPEAEITLSDDSRQLRVVARASDHAAVQTVVDRLTEAAAAEPKPTLKAYPLTKSITQADVQDLSELVPDAKIELSDDQRQLRVVALEDEHQEVKERLEQLEAVIAEKPKPTLKAYPLTEPITNGDVENLSELVPGAKITLSEENRQLRVVALEDEHQEIQEWLEQLEAMKAAQPEATLKVYPLTQRLSDTDVEELTELVPGAEITPSDNGRQLRVVALEDEHKKLKERIMQLEVAAAARPKPALKVYPLDHALTDNDVDNLSTMVPGADITLGEDSRHLRVMALDDEHQELEELIKQFETAAAAESKQELKVYPLQHPLTSSDVSDLDTLIPNAHIVLSDDGRQLRVMALENDHEKLKALIAELEAAADAELKPQLRIYSLDHALTDADVNDLSKLVPDAEIMLSDDGRQLRVMALPDDHEELGELIEQLETAATAEVQPELEVYSLRGPLSSTVLDTLESLVPEAKLTPSSDDKELIVVARSEQQALIKKTLDQIAVSADAAKEQELEIYQLEGVPADELQQLLQPLVVHSTITVDDPQDRLIVWGPPEEHEAFAKVIGKLQGDPLVGTEPVLKFYPVARKSQFDQVQSVLGSLVPDAELTWDEDGTRAMVIATPKEHQRVEQTMQQLSESPGLREDQELRVYSLSSTQKTRFEVIKEDVLEDLPGVQVIEDQKTGELAVWAKPAQHEELAKTLEQLKETGETTDIRILVAYPINSGTPETVLEMLEQVYPNATFTLDDKANRIMVYAPLSDQGRIKQSISQMDVEGAPSNREQLRSYSTGDADPEVIQEMLEELVPDMRLTPAEDANKLFAWGTVRDHEALEKAIEQVREEDPAEKPVIKAYPMEGRELRSLIYMRTVLLDLVPDAAITIDPRGGSIVASATVEDHEKLKEAIDDIVKLDKNAAFQLETYPLTKLTTEQATETLEQVVPEARITAGAGPREIVVWATSKDHEQIRAALDKLEEDASEEGGRALKLHRISPGMAEDVGNAIEVTLPNLQILSGEGTDRLLVWGTSKDHERLDQLIQQLEGEMGLDGERKMKRYELGDVSADDAEELLNDAIGDLEYLPGGDEDELVIRAGEATHRRIATLLDELREVVASPEEVLRVHQFDEDKLDVDTLYDALSDEDRKKLSIDIERRTNSLIVRGPADRQEEFAKTLDSLVEQLPAAEKTEAVIYQLERADISDARRLIYSLVARVSVAANYRNDTLTVTATPKQHVKVKDLLDQLESTANLRLETYTLDQLTVDQATETLENVVPDAEITEGNTPRQIVVWAKDTAHELIQTTLEQLEQNAGQEDGRVLKSHLIRPAVTEEVNDAMESTLSNLEVVSGEGTERLLVRGTPEDHERLAELIQQVESEMGLDGERIMRRYELGDASVDDAQDLLDDAISDLQYLSGGGPDELLIRADEASHSQIATLLDELKQVVASPDEVLKVHQFEADDLDVDTVYEALSDEDTKDLSIQVNTDTNSLIVRGPADRQQEFAKTLDSLVEQLPAAEKPKGVVYRLDRRSRWPMTGIAPSDRCRIALGFAVLLSLPVRLCLS